jgi:hypothetical protein
MELGSRFINGQVVEYLAKLGWHNWRLSEDERFFIHRYLYLSTLEAFRTLGIRYTEQDQLIPPNEVFTDRLPEGLRLPPVAPLVLPFEEDHTGIIQLPIQETNGHTRKT